MEYIATSVSNSVLKMQYRGRYNTGISKMSNTVIEAFLLNIPLPLKKWAIWCQNCNKTQKVDHCQACFAHELMELLCQTCCSF
jgi:hypothetical protein